MGRSLRHGAVVFILALALGLAPLAGAEAFGPDRGVAPGVELEVEQPRVERVSSFWSVLVSLWEQARSVWGKAGAYIDPFG